MRFSSRVDRLAGSGAAAWDLHDEAVAAHERGEDVILLSVGDPDLESPQPAIAEAVRALETGDTHYVQIAGRPRLRAAVAAAESARRSPDRAVDPSQVVVFAGAQNALFSAAMCLFDEGDEVLVLDPTYVTYEATLGAAGARMVPVCTSVERGFRLDSDALEAATGERTAGILIANPNNPTGVVLTPDECAWLADFAERHDLWVIADEVYAELVFGGDFCAVANAVGPERSVTIGSVSKSHAMTGWRAGWLVGPPELATHAERLALCMLYGLPGFVQEAAATALEECPETVTSALETYRGRHDLINAALGEVPGLEVRRAGGGMFVMVDVTGTGLTSAEFCRGLFDAHRVALLDAEAFGANGAGNVRLSFVADDERLADACNRIAAFCASHAR